MVGLRIIRYALTKFLRGFVVHQMEVITGRVVLIGKTVSRAASAVGSQFLKEWGV